MPAIKGRYWLLTIPVDSYTPTLKDKLVYLKGQQEIGADSNYHHWQLLAVFNSQVTLQQCKAHFVPQAHVELSRSDAANEYVWKQDTRVQDTQFELGSLPKSRARKADWDAIYNDAKVGNIDAIPKDILIRNYNSIKRIRVDNMQPPIRDNITVNVFWGVSGTGKTRRAWHEAGNTDEVYIKNPNTKWWDGYRGQKKVIVDEFVGRIDISYILTWLDRYPCNVEVKGYSVPLEATEFWFTSNVDPNNWYPDINPEQLAGLRRRLNITHFITSWSPDPSPNPIQEQWSELMNLLSGNDFLSE